MTGKGLDGQRQQRVEFAFAHRRRGEAFGEDGVRVERVFGTPAVDRLMASAVRDEVEHCTGRRRAVAQKHLTLDERQRTQPVRRHGAGAHVTHAPVGAFDTAHPDAQAGMLHPLPHSVDGQVKPVFVGQQ